MSALKNIPALADRLVYLRRIKGLTQADLARLAGTSQQAIQQAESGRAQNPRYLPRLARALDVPVAWLSLNENEEDAPIDDNGGGTGLAEKDPLLNDFYAMPEKDQDLIRQLIQSRKKKS